ncbi:cytochrome b/b6 domain-containing protein, partial [Sneathiella sp.]|uniref:cytochrome b/b6 domain-containing protein n=1 Tax=Sneathiella sp. TaxID=1964365 RepID=UPI0035671741
FIMAPSTQEWEPPAIPGRFNIKLYISHLIRLRLPPTNEPSPLAGAIQGLGLLIATGMATTGTIIFFFTPDDWRITGMLRWVFEIHELLGNFMWAYLAVHVAASIAHQVLGHGGIMPILLFWRKNPEN